MSVYDHLKGAVVEEVLTDPDSHGVTVIVGFRLRMSNGFAITLYACDDTESVPYIDADDRSLTPATD